MPNVFILFSIEIGSEESVFLVDHRFEEANVSSGDVHQVRQVLFSVASNVMSINDEDLPHD